MENKDNTAYLRLMMDSFRKIREYIGDMSQDEFLKEAKLKTVWDTAMKSVPEAEEEVKKYLDNIWSTP